jgi:hypothetical protein
LSSDGRAERGRALALGLELGLGLGLGLAAVLAGCAGAGATPASQPVATQTARNNTMSGHVSMCVRPRHETIRAYAFDGRLLPFRIAGGHEPHCRGRGLRILRIQTLVVAGEPTFVRRGGCDRPPHASRCARTPTAHVLASDLAPVKLAPGYRNGNGSAASGCTRAASTDPAAVVRSDLARMLYKRPSDLPGHSVAGAGWSNYGNPGRRFGHASANYLLWNLPRTASGVLPGGGIVEAVLAQGQRLELCDVPAITLPAFDARGRTNGLVRFRYAQASNAGQTIYGWVLRGYRFDHHPFTSTLRLPG